MADSRVFVAVPEKLKDGKSILLYVIKNFPRKSTRIIITHVHLPPVIVPVMGAMVPASAMDPKEWAAHRELAKQDAVANVEEYLYFCYTSGFKAEKLVVESDEIAKGLLEVIKSNGVTTLVMGAATSKFMSKRPTVVKSRASIEVKENAELSCKILFVYEGELISTREAQPTGLDKSLPLPDAVFRPSTSLNTRVLQGAPEGFSVPNTTIKVEDSVEYRSLLQAKIALEKDRELALQEAADLRKKMQEIVVSSQTSFNSEFSYSELVQATQNFSESLKIGEGGFAYVYKGSMRNTTVAIKMLKEGNFDGKAQFDQEIAVLSRVRHPNLVTLIGACSEASALVYEFLPNGSLEDRLNCTSGTLPLSWQTRIRIISEVSSALIFLHENKPNPVVHGDLKPANILLDANLVSKLSDFGISRLLIQAYMGSTSVYATEHPMGTPAYMDPEYLLTGELTRQSDIYSLGIMILRIITGKGPVGLVGAVTRAIEGNDLQAVLDSSAGDWPIAQTRQLARIALNCAELRRKDRPNLVEGVWKEIEQMRKAAMFSISQPSLGAVAENRIPSYFLCPITGEVMKDPRIAADGFTYEAVAIQELLDSGCNVSPMTSLPLPHHELVPNHALHAAIQEWQQQQQQQQFVLSPTTGSSSRSGSTSSSLFN